MKTTNMAVVIAALAAVACTPPARYPDDRGEHHGDSDHDEAPDPRLEEPSVIAGARNVRVMPNGLQCASEILGLVDVHEPVRSTSEGLELLKRRAFLLGAEAVTDVEFEHGEGGSEKTHLAGTAVRCHDVLEGRRYDVLGEIEVSGEMEHEDDAFAELKSRARAKGANVILHVHFEHGEGERTKLTGTAVHAYDRDSARR